MVNAPNSNKILIQWKDLLGASCNKLNDKSEIFEFIIYTFEKEPKNCGLKENRYLSKLRFYHSDINKLKILEIII